MEWLDTLMQWLHLSAAVIGIGGIAYARLVVVPSLAGLPPEPRTALLSQLVTRMRPISFGVVGVLLLTGLYNLLVHLQGHTTTYHIALGIKILLALHVFATAFLLAVPVGVNPARDARRPRLMAGMVISGVIILLISAFLRRAA
jgi:putative copper export protein